LACGRRSGANRRAGRWGCRGELERDGCAASILDLADTERLDPAILERPSRFDRKYTFEAPALAERVRYLGMWSERVAPAMRLDERETTSLAEITSGLSFAYLQELMISSMVRWVSEGATGRMVDVAGPQVDALRAQMTQRPDDAARVAVADTEHECLD
jgi:hypothetical protein